MTEPAAGPTTPAIDASAAAIVENKGRLGLVWDIKPGTVMGIDSGTGRVSVIVDGDSVLVSAESMIGTLDVNSRVFVEFVPPGGVFICGHMGTLGRDLNGSPIGSAYWTGGSQAGSTGTEVTAAWTAASTFILKPGRVAKLTLMFSVLTSSAAITAQVVRVRNVVGSIIATQILFYQYVIPAGFTGNVAAVTGISYIQNRLGADAVFNPGLTNIRSIGAGTSSIFGDGNLPITLTGVDIGSIADPTLAAITALAPQV